MQSCKNNTSAFFKSIIYELFSWKIDMLKHVVPINWREFKKFQQVQVMGLHNTFSRFWSIDSFSKNVYKILYQLIASRSTKNMINGSHHLCNRIYQQIGTWRNEPSKRVPDKESTDISENCIFDYNSIKISLYIIAVIGTLWNNWISWEYYTFEKVFS